MKVFYVCIFLFFLNCKSNNIFLTDLEYKNSHYYNKNILYSGSVFNRFEENGRVSFIAKINEGIPSGNWRSLGYDGEIIQNGRFLPVKVDSVFVKIKEGGFKIERINYNEFHEGDYTRWYIVFISNDIEKDITSNDESLVKLANSLLPAGTQINQFKEVTYILKKKEF
jgi:hypothetical protein